jgi:hypothetical protein
LIWGQPHIVKKKEREDISPGRIFFLVKNPRKGKFVWEKETAEGDIISNTVKSLYYFLEIAGGISLAIKRGRND